MKIGSNGSPSGHLTVRVSPRSLPDIPPGDHEQAKTLLRPFLVKFCENLGQGIENNERRAMNMYPRVMGMIGAEVEVNVNLATMQAFGMPADEVRGIVEAHRQSSATSIEQCSEDGIALLQWVLDQEPERRSAILVALGGGDALALGKSSGSGSNGRG